MPHQSLSLNLFVMVANDGVSPDEISGLLELQASHIKKYRNLPDHYVWIYSRNITKIQDIEREAISFLQRIQPKLSGVAQVATRMYLKFALTTSNFMDDYKLSPALLTELSKCGLAVEVSFMYIGSDENDDLPPDDLRLIHKNQEAT